MSDPVPKIPKDERRTKSGQTPAVVGYRKKMASIGDGVLPQVEELNRQIEAEIQERRSERPPPDVEIEVTEEKEEEPTP